MREITGLTCLRGLAAMWVVLYHIRKHFGSAMDYDFIAKGHLAVDVFFVLSGFILSYVYLPAIERGDFRFRSFMTKRLARIYPVHFVTMILALIVIVGGSLAGLTQTPIGGLAKPLITNVLLLHSFGLGSRVLNLNYPSWSISAEFFAYLLFFPLVAMCRKVPVPLGFSSLFLAMVAIASPYLFGDNLFDLSSFGLPRVLPEFLLGIALFVTIRDKQIHPVWLFATPALIIAPILILKSDIAFVFGATACIAILYLTDRGFPRHGLRSLTHLGIISYSIYMVHALVEMTGFKVLERAFGIHDGAFPLLFLPLILLVTIAVGHVCWRFVEQPAHRMIVRSLSRRRGLA